MLEIQDYINENNIIKDQIYNEFKFSIICPICTNIIYEPMMCMKCQNVYCRSCIIQWSKIKTHCPNRCANPNYQKSIAKSELLSKLRFKCKYCEEIYDYNNMIIHYFSNENNTKNQNDIFGSQIKGNFQKIENSIKQFEPKNKIKSKKKYLYFFIVISLGVSGVGKTSLIYSFENGYSMINHLSTMGLEEKYNVYRLSDGSTIGCTIFDTNGTERYRYLNEIYYKKVNGCIIVYDITNRRSFDEIEKYYIPTINEKCKKNIPIILIGNKKDMEDKRKISFEEGYNLASKYNFIFYEVSCIECINISNSFQKIIELTYFEKKKYWFNESDNDSVTLSSKHFSNLNNRRVVCC